MNYIYEQHVALLRINYLIADLKLHCKFVSTSMYNESPFDLTNIEMWYAAMIDNEKGKTIVIHNEQSLPELIEAVRLWAIEQRDEEQISRCPGDGTHSMISSNCDNSMTIGVNEDL